MLGLATSPSSNFTSESNTLNACQLNRAKCCRRSGRTEVHILDGGSNFWGWLVGVATPVHSTDHSFVIKKRPLGVKGARLQ